MEDWLLDPSSEYHDGLSAAQRRVSLLNWRRINLLLDVGANAGQYAGRMRAAGYGGRIVSFEPLSQAFDDLTERSHNDPTWECYRQAVGDRVDSVEINVSENSISSSLFEIAERSVRLEPDTAYVAREQVPLTSLSAIWHDLVQDGERVYLKLDVQGYELNVLHGAEPILSSIDTVEAELSLVPLYVGAPPLEEVLEYIWSRNFRLASMESVFDDPSTGEMLQADAIFVRDQAPEIS